MRRRLGFTLVEMLLVVAVIALLISILLPSMQKSKEMTRRSVCASNLHQASVALDQYITDSRKRYPGGNATVSPGHGIDSTYVVPSSMPMGLAYLITLKYCPVGEIFYCPSWTHPWNQYDQVDVAGNDAWFGPNEMGGWPAGSKPGPTSHRGFAYHYRSTFGPSANRPPSLSFAGGGAMAVAADHWVQREVLYGKAYGHRDGYNALYLDGRVSWKVDQESAYMLMMQPPAMGLTNGNWTYQEIIWQQFFDK